ncbi:MAG: protein-disulfide reductase DsbD N-terminal domain-containing protein [Planctomycetes bacterium]|nr:protein-disulfide reductase DsbD N-terminal domain-containing protein [Planctomycetota bacterium]
MQGNIDYFGKDRLAYLLYDCGGTSPADVTASEERLRTYGMRDFDVVRTDFDASGRELPALFGHFGYGAMVIDAAGNLRGANLHGDQVFAVLKQLLELADETDEGEADEAARLLVRTSVDVKQRGRTGLGISNTLTRPMTATVVIELQLPEGYHVYGMAAGNPTPTTVAIRYAAGVTAGPPEMQNLKDVGDGVQHAQGPVRIHVPVELPKGTPVGQYVVHGTVRFMACDARQCLPPTELKWHAVITAL